MGFNLRSGNGPLKFKQMGSTPAKNMLTGSYAHKFEEDSKETPAYLKEFGMGEGTSPAPVKDAYSDAKKKEPNLDKIIAERNKHKPGSTEYEAEHAKVNAAYGKVRNQDTLKKAQALLENKEEPSPDAEETNVTETAADKITGPKVNKFATAVSKVKGKVVTAATNALNAVYGTGVVDDSGQVVFSDKKKKKDDETGEEKVDKLLA